MRPAEVEHLIGDAEQGTSASSAGSREVSFEQLIRMMVDADLELLKRERR